MKEKQLITILLAALAGPVAAQQADFRNYRELPDPKPVNKASWEQVSSNEVHVRFSDIDTRYEKRNAPDPARLSPKWEARAWKNEQVHTQLLIWTAKDLAAVSMELTPLQDNKGHRIPASHVSTGFVRYVLTDELNKDGTGCGYRKPWQFDSSLVADGIDEMISQRDIPAYTTQPVWLSVQVPAGTPAGLYQGSVKVKTGGSVNATLPYQVQVLDRTLPPASDWKFHLDLWQSPYAVSRMYNVKEWSPAHFAAMKPYMQMLADAGQKVITTSIIYDPWNGQTQDIYGAMIKWTRKKDGSWSYDYTAFDAWVRYMMDLGIKKEVNCYSMIPWNLKFYYYDEASSKDTFVVAKPGSAEYAAHWKPMLADFAKHLKKNGWFNITAIAMDERPMQDMRYAIDVIKSVDKDFKVSLAGNYHKEIEKDIYDYCVASEQVIPQEIMQERTGKSWPTTFYTYCHEGYPNTFTFSPPAEAAWLGWHAAHKGYSGYLRWAYNAWVPAPLQDSRFRSWAAGDTYFVYPGPRSSIRFERLKEGIQDYEKIRVLREEFTRTNNTAKLQQLNALLAPFELAALKSTPAADMLKAAKEGLNTL